MLSERGSVLAVCGAVVLVLSAVGSVAVVGGQAAGPVSATAVDATPTDPNAEATHTVRVALGDDVSAVGDRYEDAVVDYSDGPSADVSNVGASSIGRVGVDRDGDAPGTRIDESLTVTAVSGFKDGTALRVTFAGETEVRPGDELVLVLTPVQNPQNAGTPEVSAAINTEGGAVGGTDTVTYEYNDAATTFDDQATAGERVVVQSVTVSEGGFVAVQNGTGADAGLVRGSSDYLAPGTHEDVVVTLDEPVEGSAELVAQPYTDTDGDRRFEFAGGEVDDSYRNRDGNPLGADSATVSSDGEPVDPGSGDGDSGSGSDSGSDSGSGDGDSGSGSGSGSDTGSGDGDGDSGSGSGSDTGSGDGDGDSSPGSDSGSSGSDSECEER